MAFELEGLASELESLLGKAGSLTARGIPLLEAMSEWGLNPADLGTLVKSAFGSKVPANIAKLFESGLGGMSKTQASQYVDMLKGLLRGVDTQITNVKNIASKAGSTAQDVNNFMKAGIDSTTDTKTLKQYLGTLVNVNKGGIAGLKKAMLAAGVPAAAIDGAFAIYDVVDSLQPKPKPTTPVVTPPVTKPPAAIPRPPIPWIPVPAKPTGKPTTIIVPKAPAKPIDVRVKPGTQVVGEKFLGSKGGPPAIIVPPIYTPNPPPIIPQPKPQPPAKPPAPKPNPGNLTNMINGLLKNPLDNPNVGPTKSIKNAWQVLSRSNSVRKGKRHMAR